jgi:SAM-dependent methyltransferase
MSARIAVDDDRPTTVSPVATPFDSGALGRLNAWFFGSFDRYINLISARHKRYAFADIAAGTVLEIGAGVGANFDHLLHATQLIALEPNPAMHPRLADRAQARGLDVRIIGAPAENIPIPDNSIDTVICSLVLCTVRDPARALAEIYRVLKPGGAFRFVEHVAAHPFSPRRWIQATVRRPWSWLFEGCQLCRDTGALIDTSGFSDTDIQNGRLRLSVFVPVNTVISGRATKPISGSTAAAHTIQAS